MVFGLLSKERKLQRTIKKATNHMAQSPERWAAMEKLRDDGSDEALFYLLKRFTFSYNKMVEDEQEKEWVVQTMVDKGQDGMPALRRYLKSNATVAFALRILERVGDPAQVLEVTDEMLAEEEPGYTRDISKRLQIIGWLGEWKGGTSPQLAQRIAPYLGDFDESVRFAAAESLSPHLGPETRAPLVAALVSEDEESNRFRVRVAELLADAEFDLADEKERIEPLMGDVLTDFQFQHNKLVRKQ
ncbi:HEAT repeat domain-containing protein [Haliangium ochraceum]|uniref:PBS lyase HEAT domain protein repeat-containing protein n=1 Tax=Haliangium ochraceum (strain DSM 14365 / JCM 11303 / SMP-2) TaxID=502025 RepID=D0LKY3_HALO1|nr:hypothetical protein [Haliangium ochraceum]ACY16703.1 hypothetical protein Hoch_4205 [Haliangium ochraceum DSM 14365]